MLTDVIDSLDRRYQLVRKASESPYPERALIEAHSFLEFIQSEPRTAAAFDELMRRARAAVVDANLEDRALVEELRSLRSALVQRFPGLDDSSREPPGPAQHDTGYPDSLAYFDRLSASDGPRFRVSLRPEDAPATLSEELLAILHAKHRVARDIDGHAWDETIGRALSNVAERVTRLRRDWILWSRASVEAQAFRLREIDAYVRPEPALRSVSVRAVEVINTVALEVGHPLHDLRAKLFGEPALAANTPRDARLATLVFAVAEQVYEGVRAEVGTAHSHRALVERFRLRAELYDASELRRIADAASRPEDALAGRLARFLFDQGLNPLTRPRIGGLEPDLLERGPRWTLYLEAKQYSDAERARRTIVSGMRQVWDTLSRLQSGPARVREAFYVVFRRDGPRYVLPDELRSEGVTVYPVLVDIAETAKSGARQRHQPRRIDEADLLPRRAVADDRPARARRESRPGSSAARGRAPSD